MAWGLRGVVSGTAFKGGAEIFPDLKVSRQYLLILLVEIYLRDGKSKEVNKVEG
jgi:hypothetical protein